MLSWLENGTFESYLRAETSAPGSYRVFQKTEARQVLQAGDVMRSSLVTVSPEQSVEEAAATLSKHQIHHLPVVKDAKLVGLVSDRDIFAAEQRSELSVEQIMSRKLLTARENSAISSVAQIMTTHHINCVLVIDEDQRLEGLMTSLDILACMSYQAPIEVWL